MSAIDLAGVLDAIRPFDAFVVCTHAGPDGDAIGSMLAMRHLLQALGKSQVVCLCDDSVPRMFQWLSGAEDIRVGPEAFVDGDLVILVDVSRRHRLGRVGEALEERHRVLVVDHHLDEAPCGALNFVDPSYAATGEILADLYEAAGLTPTLSAAECMYVAQVTDTGGFRFASTNGRSHRIAARLVDTGIDVADISTRVFDALSPTKFALLVAVLDRVQLTHGGRVATSFVTGEELQRLKASGEDVDGLVNLARNIEGVDVAMLLKEVGPRATKVSLRSRRSFNSAEFLGPFGGGGHAGAAGATLPLSLESARTTLLEAVSRVLGVAP